MSTAILLPSLNRPQRLADMVQGIHAATPEDHRILFCVSDDESKDILTGLGEWFLDDSDTEDRRYVTRMNKLIKHLDGEEFVFFGSDDVIHHPGWLTAALKVMAMGPEMAVVNDLRNMNGTQALVRTSYLPLACFDDPTAAFHHGYWHNFAESEQFYTGSKRGAIARATQSYVEHLHPVMNGPRNLPWDATYTNAAKGWEQDQALYLSRIAKIDELLG